MLVVGGYLITEEQLIAIGKNRGVDIQRAADAARLNNLWESKGITNIKAIPVCYPRSMPNEPDKMWIVIASESRHIEEIHPMYVEQIEEPTTGPGAESKWWLESKVIDAKWATVVDPFIQAVFTTDGRVQGEPMD